MKAQIPICRGLPAMGAAVSDILTKGDTGAAMRPLKENQRKGK